MLYSLLNNENNVKVLTVLENGVPYVATSDTHPQFNELVQKVLADDYSVLNEFSPEQAVAKQFERLSERVSVAGGQVFFDGDAIDDTLTEQILRFLNDGIADWNPLVLFLEKVQQNPNEHSREQLFRWLARNKFTLTHSGDIVGYKSVRADFTSMHSGPAIVDNVAVNGHVPNNIGSTIEMSRSSVNFDPSVGCSTGLHVANWDYANSWSSEAAHVLEVHVNPRDVVSVPTDAGDAKVRVCRYVVVGEVTEPYDGPVLAPELVEDESDFDEEEDYCYECGDSHYPSDFCPEYDEDTPVNIWGSPTSFVSGTTTAGKSTWDTRMNYTVQKRDANGRFIPKS